MDMLMSAFSIKQTLTNVCYPAKADIRLLTLIYCFRPKADTQINQILQINVMVDQNNEPPEILPDTELYNLNNINCIVVQMELNI